jgi:PTH2 family peptidyl-tRNA hydrolase
MYKQVIAVRHDLKLSRGKLAVQVAHASLEAYGHSDGRVRQAWESEGAKKVVVRVDGLRELRELHRKARSLKLPCALISDAGRTELEPGTVTALGIGPVREGEADGLTGNLKML